MGHEAVNQNIPCNYTECSAFKESGGMSGETLVYEAGKDYARDVLNCA